MATTNNVQENEPPRSTALERQVQTLIAAVERRTKQNHDLDEQLRQRVQDLTFRRKTKKVTVPNEGTRRGQRAATPQADQSGKT